MSVQRCEFLTTADNEQEYKVYTQNSIHEAQEAFYQVCEDYD